MEEEDEEGATATRISTQSIESSSAHSAANSNPTLQLEILKIEDDTSDILTNEEEEDDAISRINIIDLKTLNDGASVISPPPTPLAQVELDSLCQALSDISLNQQPTGDEYVEEEDDNKEKKTSTKIEPTLTVHTQPTATSAPPPAEQKTLSDPLAESQPKDTKIKLSQEQVHDILAPYYRTIDEPWRRWSQQTPTEPRITLAAMFKANSKQFQKDSLGQRCSRDTCQFRRHCYWEREWEQRQGRGMYHYTQCMQY